MAEGVYFLCSTLLPRWNSKTLLLYLPHLLSERGHCPPSSPPFGLSAPKATQIPQKHQCIPSSFSGDLWACLQPSLSVCQRGNPLSRPICPSPAFPGCLRVLWGEGWGPCLSPHPPCPLLGAAVSGPELVLLHWLLKARAAPRAPHLCLPGSQLFPAGTVALPNPGEPGQVGWA